MRKNYVSQAVHELRECPSCHKKFVSNTAAHIYCTRECYFKTFWVSGGIYSTQENKEIEIAKRVEKRHSKFMYIGGYSGADGHMYVMCMDCGVSFKYSMVTFKKYNIKCPNCENKLKQIMEEEAEQAKIAEQEEKERQREQKKEQKRLERIKPKSCGYCGKVFPSFHGKKYCSEMCAKRAAQEKKDILRRNRLKTQKIDDGITLKKIYEGNAGKCYICGCKCNFDDYVVKNGAFISGDSYPTKEHIIPLSRGGKHSWNNVKLACFRCNTEKRDMTYEEFQENKRRNRKSS